MAAGLEPACGYDVDRTKIMLEDDYIVFWKNDINIFLKYGDLLISDI